MLGGVQHVLAMFAGIVTPPLIVAGALGLDAATAAILVSAALFTSGVTTLIQVRRIGPVGSGLLSVQGTSFTFVPLAILAGQDGGLPLVFGMTLLASPTEMIFSRFIPVARRLFPPVVTGAVVMLIGINLIAVGMTDLAGGHGAADFGSLSNVGLGAFVLAVIVLLHRFGGGWLRTVSIAGGLVAGYLLAAALGRVDPGPMQQAAWLSLPTPLHHGLAFDPVHVLPWLIAYGVTTIESIGDLTASSEVSDQPVQGPIFLRRLQGGVLADGLGSAFAGIFGAMPNTTFSQNNGIIALTGVAARRVGLAVGILLIAMGLLPKLAAVVSVMPKPVLGGATLVMFGMVAVAGIRIASSGGLPPRDQFILAVSLAIGVGLSTVPGALSGLDAAAKGASGSLAVALQSMAVVAKSGLAVGALVAVGLNLLLPDEAERSGAADP